MESIKTRDITIGKALEAHYHLTNNSYCTGYIIIKENDSDLFGVVPKISSFSRFFMKCCCSKNYYTKEQADKTVVSNAIGGYVTAQDEIPQHLLLPLDALNNKFGEEIAAPFSAVVQFHKSTIQKIKTKNFVTSFRPQEVLDAVFYRGGSNVFTPKGSTLVSQLSVGTSSLREAKEAKNDPQLQQTSAPPTPRVETAPASPSHVVDMPGVVPAST